MSKYDKTVAISHEEEGTYHRREYERSPSRPVTTSHSTERYLVPARRDHHQRHDTSDDDNFEEWTTSKRKVNHKTRQVETRVSRQLLVEDGKVIADSGPQVTTRIKEDNKVEECEKEKTPKNKSKFDAIENAPECESSGRILGEKKEIQRVSREVREENMQYHDERFKELTGHDVHRRAIQAPHELITIHDKSGSAHDSAPRGKMVHYSNKGKKYQDTDEILEVAKLAIDGSITKEVKRTKHHEEFSEDEKPDEKGEAEALRHEPIVTRSSRRHVDYVNDFDDTATPSCSSDDEHHDPKAVERYGGKNHHHKQHSGSRLSSQHHKHHRKHGSSKNDEAFPRYEIDPLLNSLRDEDFKPISSNDYKNDHRARYVEHSLERKERQDSSDCELPDHHQRARSSQVSHHHHRQHGSPSPVARAEAVAIPEEYRVNKQRLLSSKAKGGGGASVRERSFSPQQSKLSHRSNKSAHRSHKEDASVQAHLTDEEIERKSIKSSSSLEINQHEKTTKYLQRQSTANSSRNYYFGDSSRRRTSISSSSSSSPSDPKERMRKQGTISRDSGFKSPHHHHHRSETPLSGSGGQQQIYSVSSKSKSASNRRAGAVSPTPTTGSVGQRSVKTTTTTMSAGLADRPLSRSGRSTMDKQSRSKSRASESGKSTNKFGQTLPIGGNKQASLNEIMMPNVQQAYEVDTERRSIDTISLSSLGPNATTIKVPYRRVVEVEQEASSDEIPARRQQQQQQQQQLQKQDTESIKESASEMSLQEDIQSLSKRLADIRRKATASSQANQPDNKQHFDYKTIIENIQPVPIVPKQQQIIGAYNVKVIEHNSPFREQMQSFNPVNGLTNGSTQFEPFNQQNDQVTINGDAIQMENNNETNFNLNDYVKYRAVPALVDTRLNSGDSSSNMDYDRMSLASSCSLQSFKTYNIRSAEKRLPHDNFSKHLIEGQQIKESDKQQQEQQQVVEEPIFDENGNGKPAAWIFDPTDGSSTAIAAPVRPKRPETPKIDSKTEELVQSRGGRSYYLELVDPSDKVAKRQRPGSIDSLYFRCQSHGALNNVNNLDNNQYDSRRAIATDETRISRQILPAIILNSSNKKLPTTNTQVNNQPKRQIPFGGGGPPSFGNRSKSSSCLLSVTKPSKYSIYGGFRRPGENNKPVPRLSYSRAIGPKSQRQIDAQPKTPSRYLKMK